MVIAVIFLIGLLVIALEPLHRMNKAAVAMFLGITCWLVFVAFGSDFVAGGHGETFAAFLGERQDAAPSVKDFIASSLLVRYTLSAAEVVLFLLATTTIVEVLDNNGCFDFLHEALRTRSPRRFLWTVTAITFLLSANLDNLTTTCLMLAMMHAIVADERSRFIFGSTIVVAANFGGAFTVIGDATSLTLWNEGLVAPSAYSSVLALPCVAAVVVTTWLVQRTLPEHIRLVRTLPPYRGDDTTLNRWQRMLMLIVGIGGLWFIPTFHAITHFPAFLGALTVLGVLWIVDELCNHTLLRSDLNTTRRSPMALQYQNFQNILFFIGVTLAVGAVCETGVLGRAAQALSDLCGNTFALAALAGVLSAVAGNVSTLLTNVAAFAPLGEGDFAAGGMFWPLLSFCTAAGGSLLLFGTLAGFALWRMEEVSLRWYVRHVFPKLLAGTLVGGAALGATLYV